MQPSSTPGNVPSRADLTVAQIGEFGLIDRLARVIGAASRDPLQPETAGPIGIGDDAALWEPTPGRSEVLTTDALIENIHFRHTTTSWRDLGWKALAENVSDVAAMGALPTRAFVTLGLRPETRVADLEALYEGMIELGQHVLARTNAAGIAGGQGAFIVGGDTVSSPVTMLSITVVGELDGEGLRRAAGQPGDVLAVTGLLGGSAGGLALLERAGADLSNSDAATLAAMHTRPHPRVPEGLVLAANGVRCGMDLSDGLLGDAGKLAYACGLSASLELHRLPLPPALVRQFGAHDASMMALAGGEDYELLVAGPAEAIERAATVLVERGLMPLTVVGRLETGAPGQVTVRDERGEIVPAPRSSWDHFQQQEPPV